MSRHHHPSLTFCWPKIPNLFARISPFSICIFTSLSQRTRFLAELTRFGEREDKGQRRKGGEGQHKGKTGLKLQKTNRRKIFENQSGFEIIFMNPLARHCRFSEFCSRSGDCFSNKQQLSLSFDFDLGQQRKNHQTAPHQCSPGCICMWVINMLQTLILGIPPRVSWLFGPHYLPSLGRALCRPRMELQYVTAKQEPS